MMNEFERLNLTFDAVFGPPPNRKRPRNPCPECGQQMCNDWECEICKGTGEILNDRMCFNVGCVDGTVKGEFYCISCEEKNDVS